MTRVPFEMLVERQYGVAARWQAPAVGVSASMLRGLLARRALIEVHPGVYALGHSQLRSQGKRRLRTERQGIEIHHTTTLDAQDVTTVDGIPVTTIARTLVDLAHVVPKDHLAKALREADYLRVTDLDEIRAAMDRTRHRPGPGHAALKAILDEHRRWGTQLTRSQLEDHFLRLCGRHGLPRPRANFHIGPHEVDACWPSHRLAVELDGWARHKDRHAFQHDRTKGNDLTRAGYRLLRFTHDDVVRRPAETAATINAFLAGA